MPPIIGHVAAAYHVVAPPVAPRAHRDVELRPAATRIHRRDASDTGARWHIRNRTKRKNNAIATDSGAPRRRSLAVIRPPPPKATLAPEARGTVAVHTDSQWWRLVSHPLLIRIALSTLLRQLEGGIWEYGPVNSGSP
jgi:hypothetical protein